jgi:hypothetical protein
VSAYFMQILPLYNGAAWHCMHSCGHLALFIVAYVRVPAAFCTALRAILLFHIQPIVPYTVHSRRYPQLLPE